MKSVDTYTWILKIAKKAGWEPKEVMINLLDLLERPLDSMSVTRRLEQLELNKVLKITGQLELADTLRVEYEKAEEQRHGSRFIKQHLDGNGLDLTDLLAAYDRFLRMEDNH